MYPQDSEEGQNLRKLREEHGVSNIGIVINWWLVPGFIGMLGTLVIGKMLPHVMESMSLGRTIESTFTHLQYDLGKEFDLLFSLKFSETNIWIILLFGFILGVFIKYAYSD